MNQYTNQYQCKVIDANIYYMLNMYTYRLRATTTSISHDLAYS